MQVHSRKSFYTLDGLRGVAALAVGVLHMPHFFSPITVPNAHLAVDFFFQLSGVVIAYAYAERFGKSIHFRDFACMRFARLFPAYLIGFGLGIAVAIASLAHPGSALSVTWTPPYLATSVLAGLFMLPTPPFGGRATYLYPLDPVIWSVFFEIVVNLLFFRLSGYMKNRAVLIVATAVLVLPLLAWGLVLGTYDYGVDWPGALFGLLRTLASFAIGVCLYKFDSREITTSAVIPALLCVVMLVLLFSPLHSALYETFCIFAAFPCIIYLGIKYQPRGLTQAYTALGVISYVFYAIHKPAYQLAVGALMKFRPGLFQAWHMEIGIVFMIALAVGCYVLSLVYEMPMRKLLTRVLIRKTA